LVLGNEATGEWVRRTSFESPQNLANLLGSTLHNYAAPVAGSGPRQSYAVAGEVVDTSRGAYLYRTRCLACHTMGRGDKLGPDLRGVASARNPAWLARWIREPRKMIDARDPIIMPMMARYNNLAMPNLGLGESDVAAIIDYMKREDKATKAAPTPSRR
jgi:protein SCO1